ncbi:hypothetical protein EVAR_79818_1 [Eumeta japonica]|uniref:Uncharacterized protein n=1 Tax=Eumeta variegata TaxID=151549 RepID=A0A4C1WSQ9_EUMVA|nr:hypothetical protein EVAR_79818_1 [Eumeta japonica]
MPAGSTLPSLLIQARTCTHPFAPSGLSGLVPFSQCGWLKVERCSKLQKALRRPVPLIAPTALIAHRDAHERPSAGPGAGAGRRRSHKFYSFHEIIEGVLRLALRHDTVASGLQLLHETPFEAPDRHLPHNFV